MIQSILSVLAGYLTMAVMVVFATPFAVKFMLHATDMKSATKLKPTPSYLAVNLAYSALFAVLGGFVTASVAGRSPLLHVVALAVVILVLGIVSFAQNRGKQQPQWYGVTLMILMPLCALIGGYLESLRQVH